MNRFPKGSALVFATLFTTSAFCQFGEAFRTLTDVSANCYDWPNRAQVMPNGDIALMSCAVNKPVLYRIRPDGSVKFKVRTNWVQTDNPLQTLGEHCLTLGKEPDGLSVSSISPTGNVNWHAIIPELKDRSPKWTATADGGAFLSDFNDTYPLYRWSSFRVSSNGTVKRVQPGLFAAWKNLNPDQIVGLPSGQVIVFGTVRSKPQSFVTSVTRDDLWTKPIPIDRGIRLSVPTDDGAVVGISSIQGHQSGVVVKVRADGSVAWQRQLFSPGQDALYATDLCSDGRGGLLALYTQVSEDHTKTSRILAVDALGAMRWLTSITLPDDFNWSESLDHIGVDKAGNIGLCLSDGKYRHTTHVYKLSPTGQITWHKVPLTEVTDPKPGAFAVLPTGEMTAFVSQEQPILDNDITAITFGAEGDVRWSWQDDTQPSGTSDEVRRVIHFSDDTCVISHFLYTGTTARPGIVKLSANGIKEWSHTFIVRQFDSTYLADLAAGQDGDTFAALRFSSPDHNGGQNTAVVSRVSRSGTELWRAYLPFPSGPQSIAVNATGEAYLMGRRGNSRAAVLAKFDLAGNTLWIKEFSDEDPLGVEILSDGVVCASLDLAGITTLRSMDEGGAVRWSRKTGLRQLLYETSDRRLQVNAEGHVLVSGQGVGVPVIVKCYDGTGAQIFETPLPEAKSSWCETDLGADGATVIATKSEVVGSPALLVKKLTPSGGIAWTRTWVYPGAQDLEVSSSTITSDGRILVTAGLDADNRSGYEIVATLYLDAFGDRLWPLSGDVFYDGQHSFSARTTPINIHSPPVGSTASTSQRSRARS